MQGLRPPIAFSLFMSNTLLHILLAKVLNIIQAPNYGGGGGLVDALQPLPNRTFKKYLDTIEIVMSHFYVIYP
jgi:hypothetical protein